LSALPFRLIALAVVLACANCSAHSPFLIRNTTHAEPVGSTAHPPHTERVFVTKGGLAAHTYEVIAFLEVGRVWYGASSNVLVSMADRARELGANAVLDVRTWTQPSGFSWAAPHGSGKAVKFTGERPDLSALDGDWL
jgi:hypothetical protein